MKAEIILKTKKPNEAKIFYSIIGMKWLGGEDLVDEIKEFEDEAGLPDLIGKIGNMEVNFFIDRASKDITSGSPVLLFEADSEEDLKLIITKLKTENLYVKVESEKPFCEEYLLDPDGHKIALCAASPFS